MLLGAASGELYYYNSTVLVLPEAAGIAAPDNSTIDDIRTESVNESFSFTLKARTSHGISMIRGGDAFAVNIRRRGRAEAGPMRQSSSTAAQSRLGSTVRLSSGSVSGSLVDENGTAWQVRCHGLPQPHSPMENPYCSCNCTPLWRIPTAAVS